MDRDPALERHLLDIAARAAGYTRPEGFEVVGDDDGLGDFAASRALPGPVNVPRDWDREIAEEVADASQYARWAIQESYTAFLAGDAEAADAYERRMRVLSVLVHAWRELRRGSA